MLDASGEVIYVGKAKKLKNRVTSYFRGSHLPKVQAMVDKVADFNVIVVESEFESLVLENSLIKQHMPHYNILLKDDKSYPFIRLDKNSEYPKFEIVSSPKKDGAKYFGPYGGRHISHEIIDVVSKTLKLPTCGKSFPRDFRKSRPCLNCHMGNCRAWCQGKESREEYLKLIDEACLILEGKTSELTAELEEKMLKASDGLRFATDCVLFRVYPTSRRLLQPRFRIRMQSASAAAQKAVLSFSILMTALLRVRTLRLYPSPSRMTVRQYRFSCECITISGGHSPNAFSFPPNLRTEKI